MDENHYNNLFLYLKDQQIPETFDIIQQNQLRKQAAHYVIENGLLYKRKDQKKTRVIRKWELEPVLFMFHNDPTAAHAFTDKIMEKMKTCYYWPQMYENIKEYVYSCDAC